METKPSVQSSFQNLNFDNSCQKIRKIRLQTFEVISNFTGFLYFVPNILAGIVGIQLSLTTSLLLATRISPIHLVDEFIHLLLVLLKEIRMMGESKVISFLVSGFNQRNAEVG